MKNENAPIHLNYIAGNWLPASDGNTFPNENPSRRSEILGLFPRSGEEDADQAVKAAHQAFSSWRMTRLAVRQRHVALFLDLMEQRREELIRIVTLENGKTLKESNAEVDSALAEGRYHLHQISTLGGTTLPMDTGSLKGWSEPHPLGVFAIISPWNFPVNVMNRKTVPALLTGNTVVFKPAEFTSWSASFLNTLFEAAGFPPGVYNCLHGKGSVVGMALVRHPQVRGISFTGSTTVGKIIQAEAGPRLCRTQLELGGKNAMIVLADADIDAAVNAAMTAGFSCCGQWCTSTSRILVHRDIADAFCQKLKIHCEAIRVGDASDPETDMGPAAGPVQFKTVSSYIEKAHSEKGKLLTGGVCEGDLGKRGYFIRPTVFTGITPDMTLFREEVFGPVLAVTIIDSLDEGLQLANSVEYGLSSSIFTRDIDAATRFIREIDAGLAHVNIHSGYKHPSLPFGGWKNSGFGPPENARQGMEFFIDWKSVYVGS